MWWISAWRFTDSKNLIDVFKTPEDRTGSGFPEFLALVDQALICPFSKNLSENRIVLTSEDMKDIIMGRK